MGGSSPDDTNGEIAVGGHGGFDEIRVFPSGGSVSTALSTVLSTVDSDVTLCGITVSTVSTVSTADEDVYRRKLRAHASTMCVCAMLPL